MFKKSLFVIKYNNGENMKNKRLFKITLVLLNLLLICKLFPYFGKLLKNCFNLLLPFIIGFTFAFLLLPSVDWLVKHRIKRKYAVLLTVSLFFIIIGSILMFFIPIVVEEINFIIDHIPDYMLLLNNKIEKIKVEFSFLPSELIPNIETIELKITEFFINIIGKMFNVFTNFISYIISFLMSIILMIYFLLDFDKICLFIKEQAAKITKIDLLEYFKNIKETIYAYFKGVILVSTIVFILSFLAFRIINIDYALMMGLIIGITDIIPYIGPYIGGAIVAAVAGSESLEKMIIVIIVVIIIQGLESWFITPKVQSKKISVHPILVLLFIVIFGKIMGIIGMLIAVPVLAILQTTLKIRLNK